MGILKEKINEFSHLEEQYKQERDRVILEIEKVVHGVGQNPAITPTSKNAFIINKSELLNTPWSPEFHDWSVQAKRLLNVLKKRPVNQWVTLVNELSGTKAKSGWQAVTIDKIQLSRKFLLRIQEQL